MSDIDYSNFPWVSSYEFDTVRFDVTDFGEGFQASIVYTKPDPEREGFRHGVIWEVPIVGQSVTEVKARLDCLIASNIFANVSIDGHGTLYDETGEEIDEICWASGGQLVSEGHDHEEEVDESTVTVSSAKVTIH